MKNHILFKISAMLMLVFSSQIYINSQTCSCAATPLSSTPEYSTLKNKKWHFELTYKYHALNDLVEGTKEVRDDTNRRRVAHFLLLDTRYALTRSLTLRAVFSLVRQEREVGISSALPVHTQGVGDSMLTAQFSPIQYSENNQTEFSFGGGIKLPIGKADAEIVGTAAEDMQPGTGSWDFIAWGYAARKIPFLFGLEFFGGVSSRFNGNNSRDYKFGNEIICSLGARVQNQKIIDYSLYGRYRWADSDKRFDADIPNTGGQWFYLVPALTLHLTKDIGLKTEGEIPLYRKLNGFRQFSTTFLLSFSIFYEI